MGLSVMTYQFMSCVSLVCRQTEPERRVGLEWQLSCRGLTPTISCCTCRHFGGTKLGAGGLVRAYGGATRDCLRAASKEFVKAQVRRSSLVISWAEDLFPCLAIVAFSECAQVHPVLADRLPGATAAACCC